MNTDSQKSHPTREIVAKVYNSLDLLALSDIVDDLLLVAMKNTDSPNDALRFIHDARTVMKVVNKGMKHCISVFMAENETID